MLAWGFSKVSDSITFGSNFEAYVNIILFEGEGHSRKWRDMEKFIKDQESKYWGGGGNISFSKDLTELLLENANAWMHMDDMSF